MAYRANRKMTIGYGKQTPWCKFCHDMGFEGYDTHYTKDKRGPGGKVVCPKLLSMECKSCGKKGTCTRIVPNFTTGTIAKAIAKAIVKAIAKANIALHANHVHHWT